MQDAQQVELGHTEILMDTIQSWVFGPIRKKKDDEQEGMGSPTQHRKFFLYIKLYVLRPVLYPLRCVCARHKLIE